MYLSISSTLNQDCVSGDLNLTVNKMQIENKKQKILWRSHYTTSFQNSNFIDILWWYSILSYCCLVWAYSGLAPATIAIKSALKLTRSVPSTRKVEFLNIDNYTSHSLLHPSAITIHQLVDKHSSMYKFDSMPLAPHCLDKQPFRVHQFNERALHWTCTFWIALSGVDNP